MRDKKMADRIKAVLSLHAGFEYSHVAAILLLDEVTLRRYVQKFQGQGIDGLLEYRYMGGKSRLTKKQEATLKGYLTQDTKRTAKEVVGHINTTYGVVFTVIGVTKLLHRLGFTYKKPKVIPGKAEGVKQEAFLKTYEETKKNLGPNDRIYFADATHPQHNTKVSYGWILKGKKNDKLVKTTSGRKRLNLNGVVTIAGKTAIVLEEETINGEATIRLLEAIAKKQKHGKVYVILDNAKHHHSRRVRNWTLNHPRFKLLFLPPYSPNLNIIERLWKFFHQRITWNRYFETFEEFKSTTLTFFRNLKPYEADLSSLLTDNFQLLPAQ